MQSSKPCVLDFPALPDEGCEGHIFPRLTYIPHVSIGKFCSSGLTYVFKAQEVTIKQNNKIIIQVPRDRRNVIWEILFTDQPSVYPTPP